MAFEKIEIKGRGGRSSPRPKGFAIAVRQRQHGLYVLLTIDLATLTELRWSIVERLDVLQGTGSDLGKLLLKPAKNGRQLGAHGNGQSSGLRQLLFPVWPGLTKERQFSQPAPHAPHAPELLDAVLITLPPWAPHITAEAKQAVETKARMAEAAARHPAPRFT